MLNILSESEKLRQLSLHTKNDNKDVLRSLDHKCIFNRFLFYYMYVCTLITGHFLLLSTMFFYIENGSGVVCKADCVLWDGFTTWPNQYSGPNSGYLLTVCMYNFNTLYLLQSVLL